MGTAGALTPRRSAIRNQRGLHARAAAKFVKLAGQFDAQVRVIKGDMEVSGTLDHGADDAGRRHRQPMSSCAPAAPRRREAMQALTDWSNGNSMKSDDKARAKRSRSKQASEAERVFEGLGVAPGIAHRPRPSWSKAAPSPFPNTRSRKAASTAELERFHGAVHKSERQLRKLQAKAQELHGAAAEELGFLLEAHMQMLSGSRVLRGVETRIREQRINAEAAVQAEIVEGRAGFRVDGRSLSRRPRQRRARGRQPASCAT